MSELLDEIMYFGGTKEDLELVNAVNSDEEQDQEIEVDPVRDMRKTLFTCSKCAMIFSRL